MKRNEVAQSTMKLHERQRDDGQSSTRGRPVGCDLRIPDYDATRPRRWAEWGIRNGCEREREREVEKRGTVRASSLPVSLFRAQSRPALRWSTVDSERLDARAFERSLHVWLGTVSVRCAQAFSYQLFKLKKKHCLVIQSRFIENRFTRSLS